MSTVSRETRRPSTPDSPGKTATTPRRRNTFDLLERYGLPALFVVMVIFFSLRLPETFATSGNFRTIATSQSVLAVAALALIFPLVTGRFDISVGANVGLSSIFTAAAMADWKLPLVLALGVGILTGAVIGVINGLLVSYLGINSIITTLGVSTVLVGIIQAYTGGIPISTGLSPALTDLSVILVAGIPALFLIMIVVAVIAWFMLEHSVIGRYFASVGSNERAAQLIGLPIRRIVLLSFVFAGVLAGVAGVLQIAAQGNGNPQVGGISFMLPALAAVFLGATTIRPGTYNVPGTVIALFFVGTAVSALALLGVEPWITDVFNGAAVIIAVGLSAIFRRRRTGTPTLGQ